MKTSNSKKKSHSLSNVNQRTILYKNCYNTYFTLNNLCALIHSHPKINIFTTSHNTLTQEYNRQKKKSNSSLKYFLLLHFVMKNLNSLYSFGLSIPLQN